MPEIETERLRLRMFTPEDFEAMYAVWTDPEVMRFIHSEGWPLSREESKGLLGRLIERFKQNNFGQWAVIYRPEEKLIGYCGLKFLDNTPEVELLYGISKNYWNRGLVTEAAKATLRYAFEETKLEEIVAIANPQNTGSWRVMEKAGMKREGLARHYGQEVVRYSMRREEFRPDGSLYSLHP